MSDNAQLVDEIAKAIAPLAQKIGASGMWAYQVVLRQQIIFGSVMLIISALSLITSIGLAFYLKRIFEKDETGRRKSTRELRGFVVIALCVFILSFIFFLGQGLLHLLNPSFYALEYFLTIVSP